MRNFRHTTAIAIALAVLMLAALPSAPALAKHRGAAVECEPLAVEVELTHWLSLEFNTGIQVCEVRHWRGRDMGYGEIALAYGLAAESGWPVSDIMFMRQDEKMGWGKIAHRLGVNLSDAVHRASYALENAHMNDESSRIIIILDSDNDDTPRDMPPGKAKHHK